MPGASENSMSATTLGSGRSGGAPNAWRTTVHEYTVPVALTPRQRMSTLWQWGHTNIGYQWNRPHDSQQGNLSVEAERASKKGLYSDRMVMVLLPTENRHAVVRNGQPPDQANVGVLHLCIATVTAKLPHSFDEVLNAQPVAV